VPPQSWIVVRSQKRAREAGGALFSSGCISSVVLPVYREQLAGWTADGTQGSSCENVFRRARAMLDVKDCDGKLELVVNYKQSR
jgi:hypothetical protein